MSTLRRISACIALLPGLIAACAGPESGLSHAAAEGQATRLAPSSATKRDGAALPGLTPAERIELEEMALRSVDHLVGRSESARRLFEHSEGYAVFDSAKVGALVTGAGGSGVAVDPEANQCVYMHMGAGGVALGGGIQRYKLVFLFEDEDAFDRFVGGRWHGGATAQAVAGKAAVEAASNFVDGMAVYQMTDKGLIAQADLTFMKFWPDRDAPMTEPEAPRCAS